MKKQRQITAGRNTSLLAPSEGKIPPQAIEIEAQVLGSMILEVSALCKVIEIITATDFHAEHHRKIFQSIQTLFEAGKTVDTITLSEELRKAGHLETVGGETYLVELTMSVTSSANVEYHARIILEKSILRQLITACTSTARKAFSPTEDAFDLLDDATSNIYNISTRRSTAGKMEGMDSLVHRAVDAIEKASQIKKHIIGTATGFTEFDEWTLGLEKGTLIVVAGRPSSGKSSLMLCMADYISQNSNGCGIFSFEMGSQNQMLKLASHKTGFSFHKLKTGQLTTEEWVKVTEAMAGIQEQKLWIDASARLTLNEIRAKIMQLKSKHGIEGIWLDYLKYIRKPEADRNDIAIGMITASLKEMAKELGIWVVLLSQLSRPEKGTKNIPPPALFDLKDSSDLEADADVVAFVHRPEAYGQKTYHEQQTAGKAWLILAKQRNGRVGEIKLDWKGPTMQFLNPTYGAPPPTEVPTPYKEDNELPF